MTHFLKALGRFYSRPPVSLCPVLMIPLVVQIVVMPTPNPITHVRLHNYQALLVKGMAFLGGVAFGVWASRRSRPCSLQAKAAVAMAPFNPHHSADLMADVEHLPESVRQIVIELQKTESALRESEAELRSLFAAMDDVVLVLDQDGRILKTLSTQSSDLHQPSEKLLDRLPQDIFPKAQAGFFLTCIQQTLATKQTQEYEYCLPLGDAKYWFHAKCSPLMAETVLWVARNISDRKQAELKLQESEARQRAILSLIPDLIYIVDTEGRVLDQVTSNPEADLFRNDTIGLGKTIYDAGSPNVIRRKIEAMHQGRITGVMQTYEQQVEIDGRLKYEEIQCVPMDGDRFLFVFHDITARKKMELALRDSELKFFNIFHTSPDPAWIATLAEGRILKLNDRMPRFLGFSYTEMLGKTCTELALWHNLEDFKQFKEILFRDGKIQDFEVIFRLQSGELRTVLLSATISHLDHQDCVIGLLKDITERKLLEQEIIKARDFRELLFNESSDALFLVDTNTLLTVDCNQRAIEMFEVASKADLLNIKGHILQKRQFTPEECATIQRTVEQKGFWNLEVEYVTHQGREFWGDISVKPITFGAQQFQLVRVADISDRKQTEAVLQQTKQQLETRIEDLNQRHRELVLLGQMSNFLQVCLTVEEAYRAIANLVEPLFPDCSGGVFIIGPARNWARSVSIWGQLLHSQTEFDVNHCWALRRGQVHGIGQDQMGLRCKHVFPQAAIATTLCIPLIAQGETLGLFYLSTDSCNGLSDTKQQVARTVAEQLALAIANLNLRETLQQQSTHDPLTGLFNRRYLKESLTQEIARAQRKQHPIGVIMLDIDHFKQFNDTYGHDTGDYVLQTVGVLLKNSVRGSDVACRYGGEEMILILPESSLEETYRRAEEIREAIAQLTVFHHGQYLGHLTVSLGVASFPQHGTTGTVLMQAVDAALYRAKAAGRNHVMVATP